MVDYYIPSQYMDKSSTVNLNSLKKEVLKEYAHFNKDLYKIFVHEFLNFVSTLCAKSFLARFLI